MSDGQNLFSAENNQTVLGVAVVLALLGVSLSFYNFVATDHNKQAVAQVQQEISGKATANQQITAKVDALRADLTAAQQELVALRAAHDALKLELEEAAVDIDEPVAPR
ncbi:MAG: hypothetical protein JXX28_04400 [Deltaproteobacteria bacterium]|nr:hypothetical protein [Deltaproteobacteria bacterium]